MRPRERVVPILALWRCSALLLSWVCMCAALDDGCVIGVLGQPVSLPCHSSKPLTSGNFSIEWKKDDKVVLRSARIGDGNLLTWSPDHTKIPADAVLSGNFSLELSAVHPRDDRTYYSLFFLSGENQSVPLCDVCLTVAARFSVPLLKREQSEEEDKTNFVCHSFGGYPQPSVYWLIDNTKSPQGSEINTTVFPDGHLYNITSILTVSISKDSSVSCIIENPSINETWSSTYVPDGGPVGSRASEAMWIFSTVLCVIVGLMVAAGVAYQIHLDRISKRRKKEYQEPQRGYRRRYQYREEAEAMQPERPERPQRQQSKETDV